MMKFTDALQLLSDELKISAHELFLYAAEDNIGGYPNEWPVGSVFASEGKILYALIRALKPDTVVEFGTRFGCSTMHILSALVKNGFGVLHSYDPAPATIASRFTQEHEFHWTLHRDDATICNLPDHADIVFEDAMHSYEMTRTLVERALGLDPYLILSHDAEHRIVGKDVTNGFNDAIRGKGKSFCTDDSDCGLIFWSNL